MPSSLPCGAAQTSFIQSSDNTPDLTVAFYNIGIQLKEVGAKKSNKEAEVFNQYIINSPSK